MSDDGLLDWVVRLIARREPECDSLDYKETLDLNGGSSKVQRKARLELAKDVTSFANTHGGVLVYGVPQEEDDGIPYPRPLAECGMQLTPGFGQQVTDILGSSIDPPLPELYVRALTLSDDKVLFLVHHPESWDSPHMVTSYEDARYYTRGTFSSAPMKERAIEQAYTARANQRDAARRFLAEALGPLMPVTLRVAIVPLAPHSHRHVLRSVAFRDWIRNGPRPHGRRGDWLPFEHGWRFHAFFHRGATPGFDVRFIHNGAVLWTIEVGDIIWTVPPGPNLLQPETFRDKFKRYVCEVALPFWERIRLQGPVLIDVALDAGRPFDFWPEPSWATNRDVDIPSAVRGLPESAAFTETSSISELRHDQNAVLDRMLDHIAEAGGYWRKSDFPVGTS